MERLILFAKSPRRGRVKTRLVPPLSNRLALDLHVAMILDQVRFLRGIASSERTIEVRLDAPLADEAAIREALAGIPIAIQGAGDLGARMRRAIEDATRAGAARVAIMGSDAPTLPRRLVDDALSRVAGGADAALVPALDGGYVLIATRGDRGALFEGIPWGSAAVLERTREAARGAGWRLEETAPWGDLDTASDLSRVAAEAATDPGRAPATAAILASLDLDLRETRVV